MGECKRLCTCVGECRGAKGLGENWACALEEADCTDAAIADALPSILKPDSPPVDSGDKAALWEAIHEYVLRCGGDPGANIHGIIPKTQTVADIERIALSGPTEPAIAAWREQPKSHRDSLIEILSIPPGIHTYAAAALEALGEGE